jgi:hypothetical protein
LTSGEAIDFASAAFDIGPTCIDIGVCDHGELLVTFEAGLAMGLQSFCPFLVRVKGGSRKILLRALAYFVFFGHSMLF